MWSLLMLYFLTAGCMLMLALIAAALLYFLYYSIGGLLAAEILFVLLLLAGGVLFLWHQLLKRRTKTCAYSRRHLVSQNNEDSRVVPFVDHSRVHHVGTVRSSEPVVLSTSTTDDDLHMAA